MGVRELSQDEEILPLIREMSPDEEIVPDRNPVERFGRGANVGIAETFGAPVDLVNWLLGLTGLPTSEEPWGGSRQLRRGFAALGIAPPIGEEDPDTLAGSMGRVTGAASGFLLPLGPATKGVTEVGMGLRAAPTSMTKGAIYDIAETAVRTPGRFMATEVTSAMAAGAGGYVARDRFPDSPAASFIGELLGGLSPAAAIGTAKILPTVIGARFARKLIHPFTEGGGRTRAERRIGETARHLETAKKEVVRPEQEMLTPAQRTGDEGLMALERAVIDSSEKLKGKSDDQIAEVTEFIRKEISGIGEDVPMEKSVEAIEQARQYVQLLVDTRMRIAARAADERIAKLAPGATREQANIIAREELEKALSDIRMQEREIWSAVPKEVTLSTEASFNAYRELLDATPKAQRGDIPAIAKEFLDPKSTSKFSGEESVAELQGLRSKLLEESRKARATGDYNTARMADELADAVLENLGAQRDNVSGEAGEALRAALDFSADLNARFTRGPVGKLLATDRAGGERVLRELTLESTLGQGGPRARTEAKAIINATETPELRGAVEDFILDDFQRRAMRGDKIDPKKAERFMTRYGDLLEEFPELRTRIESAIDANDLAILRKDQAEGLARRLADPKVSRAAVFLKEPVEDAMTRIAKSPKPADVMTEVVKQASRDETGDALKGLKTGFGDFLLSRASTRHPTVKGEFIVSGRVLKRLLSGDGPESRMARALLSTDEQSRLKKIADIAEKVEKAVAAKPEAGGIINDPPSLLFSTVARVLGAQIGRQVAVATGGGTVQTPGIISGIFKRASERITQDPARRLLMDAMNDDELYKALLLKDTPANKKKIQQQMNAWLLSIGAEQEE